MLRNREDCILRVGIVGTSENVIQQLQSASVDIMIYDRNPEMCRPSDTTMEMIEMCDLIFYCLPTVMNHHTSCDTTILSEFISIISNPYKIICSTVPIHYSQSMGCNIMISPTKEQWLVGMLESSVTEECKKRIITLREICYKEGIVLDDKIQWASTTEVEASIVYHTILSKTMNEISYKMDEFLINKNMNCTTVKNLCMFLPNIEYDIHNAYQQVQTSDMIFPMLQHIIKERDPITEEKKISLVIGLRNHKITEDVCRNLVRKDNIVILFSDTPTLLLDIDGNIMKDVLSKTGSFRHKQFFPKLDYIWDFSKMDYSTPTTYTDRINSFTETINKLELVRTHNCYLTFLSDCDEYDEFGLISTFISEYPEYEGKVDSINVLFDKSDMKDYVLH